MRFWVARNALFIAMALLLAAFPGTISAAADNQPVKLEFVSIYNLPAPDAIAQCYTNLGKLGIDKNLVTITTLESVPNKIAVQSSQDIIDIVKQIMNTIDPPPPPPLVPCVPQEVLTDVNIKNLSPTELKYKLDEVMSTFMGFMPLQPGGDNLLFYARDNAGTNKITFYIPNLGEINKLYFERKQGYQGYKVYIRSIDQEQVAVDQIKGILSTIDLPLAGKSYKAVQLYYVEIDEAIKSLKSVGYYAVNTSTDTGAFTDLIKSGVSPVIYSAPSVTVQSVNLSTNFGSGSSKDIRAGQFTTVQMRDPVATTDINKVIVYGSPEEIAAVEEYLALIDVPARQIMIEAQVIEINVDALKDLGLKSVRGIDDLFKGDITSLFPGEGTAAADSNTFIYDDAGKPAGSFSAAIQALVEDGKATIKARPKVVTVDGRQAIISIGRQVPVIQETQVGDQRSIFEINFVPVGITLNIKPRIGAGAREVQMQVDAVVSNIETINNVIADASLRAPELNTREVHDIVRIPNHQALILGGLISTETERRTYRVPILGDLPLIGSLFRRSKTAEMRTEIIIVLTPHISEEVEPRPYEKDPNPYGINDAMLIPIGTDIFDEFRNILMPSNYIIKQTDIEGMDISTLQPLTQREKIVKHSVDDPVLLTLRSIVRKLNLVTELRMLGDSAHSPSWMDPELVRYNAEAFLILYLEETNGLTIDELIPGRQIVIPSNPVPEEGFESRAPLWNSINFLQVAQKYEPMQAVVASLMTLDGKQPPETKVQVSPPENPQAAPSTPNAIAYGPYKIGLLSGDGSHKLVSVSYELIPVEGTDRAMIESRVRDIEALALAILNDYSYEELTSPDGAGIAAGKLASGIDELLGGNVVDQINLQQSVKP